MVLKFNTTMITNFSDSLINSTNVDIYIKPSMGRGREDTFRNGSLNFTWDVISFQNDTLKISLSFDKPLEISPRKI